MAEKSVQVADTVIRRATVEDAAEIANVHLNSWREAYRGLLPQEYLDQLPLTFKGRMISWKQNATDEARALFVAEAKNGIVGFAGFCRARDSSMNEYGEVGAIYLLEKFKGRGVGAALLKMGMQQLMEWNFAKAYCWVLQGNPTIKFYEKSGAIFNGMEKDDEIGGLNVKDLAYEWGSLERFKD